LTGPALSRTNARMSDPLDFPFGAAPPAEPVELAPGIFWLRLPLPFKLDHVNVWLIAERDGWCVVDTGLNTEVVRGLWTGLFDGLMAGRPVTRVLVTHMHPDHVGLAGWLCPRFEAPLLMSRSEWLYARMLALGDPAELAAAYAAFYHAAGLDAARAETLAGRATTYRKGVTPPPPRFRQLLDGDELTIAGYDWQVIATEGHSSEQLCLHCPGLDLLIAGDQVLPVISPNVSVWPSEPDADPLGRFIVSMEAFQPLPEETLVLPSHHWPFRGLHARIEQLLDHHDERLAATLATCAEPVTAAEVTAELFPKALDDHQTTFAIGEALAHLNGLVRVGLVERARGRDGRWRYHAT
jgi:glyoxylase-like metal-dependent hydrolase (beta-lactamase superfamily II)